MKQRLLLALLVLFASVGTMWGEEPAPDGGGEGGTPSANSFTFTVEKGKTAKVTFARIANDFDLAAPSDPDANDATITVSNNVLQVDNSQGTGSKNVTVSGGTYEKITFSTGIISISFTSGNGDLKALVINGGSSDGILTSLVGVGGHLNSTLTSLTIGVNKLPFVPAKTAKMTTYSISEQYPSFVGYTANTKPSNQAVHIKLANLLPTNSGFLGTDSENDKDENYSLESWRVKTGTDSKGNPTYSADGSAHTSPAAKNVYYFYKGGTTSGTFVENSNGYEYVGDSDYLCDVVFSATSPWPGLKIKNVPVKVKAASYTFNKPTYSPSNTAGTLLVNGTEMPNKESGVKKGTEYILTPQPAEGYAFDKFESSGFTIVEDKNIQAWKATVNGKTDSEVSVKAIFKALTQTVTIQNPDNGILVVKDGSTVLSSEAQVATGKTLTIELTPNEGYSLYKAYVNGEALTTPDSEASTSSTTVYKYTVTSAEKIIISASFARKTQDRLIIQWKGTTSEGSTDLQNLQLKSLTVNGNATNDRDEVDGYFIRKFNVSFNTKPTISIEMEPKHQLASILYGDEEIPFDQVGKDNGTTGAKYLVSNFTMPNKEVVFVLNITTKSDAKIVVSSTESSGSGTYTYNKNLVYDGTAQKLEYTTIPNNLSNVVVKYSKATGTPVWSDVPFTDAGTYQAKFERAADETYEAAKVYNSTAGTTEITNGIVKYEISAADVIITTKPSVSWNKDAGKYVISGNPVVQYVRGTSKQTIDSKKYVWTVGTMNNNSFEEKTTAPGMVGDKYQAEVVTLRLQLKKNTSLDYNSSTNKDENFAEATYVDVKATAEVDNTSSVTVEILTSKMPKGTSLTMMNGAESLGTKATVTAGTKITFVKNPNTNAYKVHRVDAQGNPLDYSDSNPVDLSTNGTSATGTAMYFCLFGSAVADKAELVLVSAKDDDHIYDGQVQQFDTEVITVKNKSTNAEVDNLSWNDATITYKEDAIGQTTTAPKNAGTYTVTISRPEDGTYKAFTATGTMIIKQAEPTIINWPNTTEGDPAKIGKGQPLSSAILTGGVASCKGSFEWVSPATVVNANGQYAIKFVSKDSNYKDVVSPDDAYVEISNESILSIASDETYTITVKGSDGKEYKNGQTVPVGITLTFTVTPASTYKLKTLYVNGKAISGSTYTTTAGPIAVKAEMEQEFTVSVSTTLKGIELVLPSSNVVKKGASYSFSVKGLAADLANLVVSDGTNIYTGTNGAYTISNITANKTITVTMKAGTVPTQVEAVIEANLSTQGKSMGTVTVTKISSLRADAVDSSTQKFYYGDKIRVTATPAAGCRFVGWEGRTETSSVIDVLITETSYKFKAVFAGSPTGAEVIEGVDIYGSNGEIVVKCDGAARITIVSMNGQSKQQEISGDTRIPAGAGIYGIVFEQGNNVMRTKVAVK